MPDILFYACPRTLEVIGQSYLVGEGKYSPYGRG